MAVEVVSPAELAEWIWRRAAGADRFIVGITGPPGCGKSTIAADLAAELVAPIVAMDGFHLPNRTLIEHGLLDSKGAPETFDAAAFVDVVRRLRSSAQPVPTPAFDRVADEPVADAVVVQPTDRVVIVEGNYLLLSESPWSDLRALFDVVAFVDIAAPIRIERLIRRHVEFGKRVEEATEFVMRSDERNAALVEATRDRAGVIIA